MEGSNEISLNDAFLKALYNIVFSNIHNEQFGAEDLAREVGYSRSQLHRKLHKINNKSITQFIREIRLKEAHRLLMREVGTASEISYRVGFNSPTYFNTCFHEFFGYPPGDVKRKKQTLGIDQEAFTDDSITIIPTDMLKPDNISISGSVDNRPTPKNETSFLKYIQTTSRWKIVISSLMLGLTLYVAINFHKIYLLGEVEIPSIVILPFENEGTDTSYDFMKYGLANGVISNLSGVHGLMVIAEEAAFQFDQPNRSYMDIYNKLNVDHIIEGSFLTVGDSVYLTILLVNPKTGHIWESDVYTEKIKNLNKLQAKVALGIVDAFGIAIDSEGKSRILEDRSFNITAYEYFQKGKTILRTKNDMESVEQSRHYFYLTLMSDPDYVEAYIGLAELVLYEVVFIQSKSGFDGMREIEEYVKKAQAIDQERGELYALLGLTEIYKYNWEKGREYIEKGIELSPNYPLTYLCLACIYSIRKEHDNSIKSIDMAISRDPTNLFFILWKVAFLSWGGYFDRAQFIIDLYANTDSLKSIVNLYQECLFVEQKRYNDIIDISKFSPSPFKEYALGMMGRDREVKKKLKHILKNDNYPPTPIAIIYKLSKMSWQQWNIIMHLIIWKKLMRNKIIIVFGW